MRQNWYKDAWGHSYKYTLIDNGEKFLIISLGIDGVFDTDDDIHSK